jgi:hypothetical protein
VISFHRYDRKERLASQQSARSADRAESANKNKLGSCFTTSSLSRGRLENPPKEPSRSENSDGRNILRSISLGAPLTLKSVAATVSTTLSTTVSSLVTQGGTRPPSSSFSSEGLCKAAVASSAKTVGQRDTIPAPTKTVVSRDRPKLPLRSHVILRPSKQKRDRDESVIAVPSDIKSESRDVTRGSSSRLPSSYRYHTSFKPRSRTSSISHFTSLPPPSPLPSLPLVPSSPPLSVSPSRPSTLSKSHARAAHSKALKATAASARPRRSPVQRARVVSSSEVGGGGGGDKSGDNDSSSNSSSSSDNQKKKKEVVGEKVAMSENVVMGVIEMRRLRRKAEARQSGVDYRRLLTEMENDLNVDARLLLRSWTATMIVYENELPVFYRAISLVDLAVLLLLLETTIALTFDRQTSSHPIRLGVASSSAHSSSSSSTSTTKKTPERWSDPETVQRNNVVAWCDGRRRKGEGDGGHNPHGHKKKKEVTVDQNDDGGEAEGNGVYSIRVEDEDEEETGGYLEDYHLEANLRPLGLVEIFYVCLLVTKNVIDLNEEVMLPSNASAFSPEIGVTLANYYAKYEMQRIQQQESSRPTPHRSNVNVSGFVDRDLDKSHESAGASHENPSASREETDASHDESDVNYSSEDDDGGSDSDTKEPRVLVTGSECATSQARVARARLKRRRRDVTDKFLMQRAAMLRALTSLHLHALDRDKPLGTVSASSPSPSPHRALNSDAKIVAAVTHKLGRALHRSDYHYNPRRDTLLFV